MVPIPFPASCPRCQAPLRGVAVPDATFGVLCVACAAALYPPTAVTISPDRPRPVRHPRRPVRHVGD